MHTEMTDYLNTLSRRRFFWISLLTTLLGIAIIVLGIAVLVTGQSDVLFGIMFASGCLMMIMNGHKARMIGSRAIWIFYAAAVALAVLAAWCFIPKLL